MNDLLREAEELNQEITVWYHEALLDIDPDLDIDDEQFDATNSLLVEGINFNAIMKGLRMIQIFRSTY